MRLRLAILLAVASLPARASLAEEAQKTLRGSKTQESTNTTAVRKGGRTKSKPVKTNTGEIKQRGKKNRKNDIEESGSKDRKKRIKNKDHIDKATFRAQKKAEREAELVEKEIQREAAKALRDAKKAKKEAKKAEMKSEKVEGKQAGNDSKRKEKGKLKKRLDFDTYNSTSIDEIEHHNSTISLKSGTGAGWMPTPSPIDDQTSLPTAPIATIAICPDEFDPERAEPYKAGDLVEVELNIFECQGGDFEKFCSIAELDKETKKENKDAKRLWKEAWKYVSPCGLAEITDVDGAIESVAIDQMVGTNGTVKEDAPQNQNDTVHTDLLLQPRSSELDHHNRSMESEFAEESCVGSVCNHRITDTCLLKYEVNVPQADEPNTITFELICEGVTWLGFGFSNNGRMAGSEAVIGVLGEEPQKYNLFMGGVHPMKDSAQTLIDASINVYRGPITALKFTKIMKEEDEIEIGAGDNTFLYAQGQSFFLGQHAHDSRGSFQLNLPYTGMYETSETIAVSGNPEMTVTELSPACTLRHVVNVPSYTTRDECEDCSITMELICDSVAWVAIGFSDTGFMPRSEAVIGIPNRNPKKYVLKKRNINKIFRLPNEAQTLMDASLTIEDGKTVMKFTKLLNEPNETPISSESFFLFAQGYDEDFGYHGPHSRGSFKLNLD